MEVFIKKNNYIVGFILIFQNNWKGVMKVNILYTLFKYLK
jgi:hypothetical protein